MKKYTNLTVRTFHGVRTSQVRKLEVQLLEWDMYSQADNFAGWLLDRFIMDGLNPRNAEIKAKALLRNGSKDIIDVRIETSNYYKNKHWLNN